MFKKGQCIIISTDGGVILKWLLVKKMNMIQRGSDGVPWLAFCNDGKFVGSVMKEFFVKLRISSC